MRNDAGRSAAAAAAALAACLVLIACGGSALTSAESGGASGADQASGASAGKASGAGGAGGAGGASSTAGEGGAGGGPGGGGSNSGAAGSADAGAGGAPCSFDQCRGFNGECADGYQYAAPPGECCPACIPETSNDCAQGQSNYEAFRQTQVDGEGLCNTDADCVLVLEDNDCTDGCGLPVNVSAKTRIVSTLNDYAHNNCATCPPPIPPPCVQSRATCSSGVCALVAP